MEYEPQYQPVNVVLAVDADGEALVVSACAIEKDFDLDWWLDSGYCASDNGFEYDVPIKEPGLYNCIARPYWDGVEDDGEMRFRVFEAKQIARFVNGVAFPNSIE